MNTVTQTRKRLLVLAAVAVAILVASWQLWRFSTRAPLRSVEALTARLTSPEVDSVHGAERRAQWHEWRREVANLSPVHKHEFWSRRGEQFRVWLRELMNASQERQAAVLKEILGHILGFRKHWATMFGGMPDWWADLSPIEREKRQQEWLSMASPEERALVNLFLQALAAQAQQLGLATTPSPWGDDAPS